MGIEEISRLLAKRIQGKKMARVGNDQKDQTHPSLSPEAISELGLPAGLPPC
jgi:hypothetical protein